MLENHEFLTICKKQLTQREQSFIELRYNQELSQDEIAPIMGVSQMQISRLEKKLLKKLRDMYFKE
jgi:RNA polymerase sporulation-specific sigma factor